MDDVGAKEAVFRWIFEDHPDGVLVVDAENRVISANRRLAEVCGTGSASTGGGALEEFARQLPILAGTTRDDMILADGSVVERDCTPLRALDGTRVGCVWFFRDVTARREIEVNLWAQLDELRRWQDVMVEREWRMAALKREINDLCVQRGEAIRYPREVEAPDEDRTA